MSFVSHAQNFEDVMLWRALKHIEKGFYIDVGANDPNQDSVTKAFYERGWRGINLEPVPQWFEKLERERLRDINLQVAAGAEQGELTLYELADTGLSTLDLTIAERHEVERGYIKFERVVPVKTLTQICQEYHAAPIHFLKVDVEGAEKQVLDGLDFSIIRPWIILVESTLPSTQVEDYEEWEPILLQANYDYVYFDGLNRFYVAHEHKELISSFRAPPNCFDDIKLSVYETHAQRLQKERDVAKVRQDELTGELVTIKANAEHLSAQLEEKAEALTYCQVALAEQQARADTLQNEGDKAKSRLEELAGELATAKVQAQQLDSRLDKKAEALTSSQGVLSEQQSRADTLQKEWDTAKEKIDELNHSSHHWWTVADNLNNQLQTVYNSKSWRITWPLRKLMQFFRWFFYLPIRFCLWFIRLPKRIVRWLLVKAMAFALKRPDLKAQAVNALCKCPRLDARLRRLVQGRSLVASQPSSPATPSLDENGTSASAKDLSQLTPQARRIYAKLKAAIEQRQKENG